MPFEIRSEKETFNTVENPAAVFDLTSGTLHRIGEREAVIGHFNVMTQAYRARGLHDMADDVTYFELPKDQAEIDKVFNITGYIKRLYERAVASEPKGE